MTSPKDPTLAELAQQVRTLQASLNEAQRTITKMQQIGGFADSKSLGLRSTRLEQRVEKLEFDGTLHKDLTAHVVDLLTSHLMERHQLGDTDNSPDMIFLRKIKRRLREWAEAVAAAANKRGAQSLPTG